MYRIGDFSILNKITIKALRYYDEIDLLKPAIVDKYTGYRYYSEEQRQDLNRIQRYKDLGMTLNQIKELQKSDNKKSTILVDSFIYLFSEFLQQQSRQLQFLANH